MLVGAEEVDERAFLFGRQLGADPYRLGWIGVVDHIRLGLTRLARVKTALRSGDAKLAEFAAVVARSKYSRLLT